MDEHVTGPLRELRYKCLDESVDQLMAGSLLRSSLVALLDGRELDPFVARFHTLERSQLPPRADNCLRFVACMQAVADVLGNDCGVRLANDVVDDALQFAENKAYLWPSFIDLAMGLALRWGDRQRAQTLLTMRMKAPLGSDLHALGLLTHAIGLDGSDAQTKADLGHLSADAALFMTGTAVASTLLGMAAIHDPKQFQDELSHQARVWNTASQQVERLPAVWSLNSNERRLCLSVEVRGSGDLHACAGWALDDLVYLLPGHLDQLMRKQVPLSQISGAKTRNQVTAALNDGHLTMAARLRGVHLSQADRAALLARQDGALNWIRHEFSELRSLPAGLEITVSNDL